MKAIGTILIILALVGSIVPQFTDCQSQGRVLTLQNGKTVDMKCHWTSIAALVAGIPLLLVGGSFLFTKKRETHRTLSLIGLVLGAFFILLPTALIGVCAMPDMICNSVMRPTMILTGILTIVVSGVALVLSWKSEGPTLTAASPA
jgi:LPXTG-motif cell wall-anchored protein